jgi:hypothetical protein
MYDQQIQCQLFFVNNKNQLFIRCIHEGRPSKGEAYSPHYAIKNNYKKFSLTRNLEPDPNAHCGSGSSRTKIYPDPQKLFGKVIISVLH